MSAPAHDAPAHDAELAGITRLAAQLCGARTATVRLADGDRADALSGACGQVVVPDVRRDPRWAGHPGLGRARFLAALPLRDEGELLGALLVLDDEPHALDGGQRAALAELAAQAGHVLARRRRESDLLDALGQLLRSNDELTAFAARVAHDLRAPLTAVLGFLALADGPFRDGTSERAAECVTAALGAARRMRSLVDDLLAYAVFDARPRPGRVPLAALVREVVADLGAPAAEVGYEGPDEVAGDATLLRQLVQNLVGNAVAHAGPAPRVCVRAVVDAAGLQLDVLDDGPGVPVPDRERVLDPLVRRPGSTGSGIGLATCVRIVDALGGTITVGDAPGGGALFRVRLPPA